MNQKIQIPIKAWYGDEETSLHFPEGWNVQHCQMAGHDTPALNDNQLRESLENPYETETLRKLARNKKKVVILFDDLTRPAPTHRIIPFVLESLSDVGCDFLKSHTTPNVLSHRSQTPCRGFTRGLTGRGGFIYHFGRMPLSCQ